jgi:hypothetical protein
MTVRRKHQCAARPASDDLWPAADACSGFERGGQGEVEPALEGRGVEAERQTLGRAPEVGLVGRQRARPAGVSGRW